jgi:hypothetical protein
VKLLDDRAVRWLLVPAVVFISQTISDAYLLDFRHHLARGREIVTSGRLLDHDVFTYTVADRPFQDVNWGSQVIYYSLYQVGGLGLVRVMNALVLAVAWAWLIAICRRQSGSLEAALIAGMLAFLGSFQVLTIRPQTFSIFLFIAMLDVLLRAERDRRWLLGTLPIMIAWPNLHGAFPAGLILVGISWLAACVKAIVAAFDERRGSSPPETHSDCTVPKGINPSARQIFAWTAAFAGSILATLVNPYGWDIYRYAGATSEISVRRQIDEWLPPGFDQWAGIAFFLSMAIPIWGGLCLFVEARRNGVRPSLREGLQLLVFFVLAIRAVRMVVWWFLVLAPMFAVRLAVVFPRLKVNRYQPNVGATLSVVGLVGVCLLCLPPLHAINPLTMIRPHDPTTERLQAARDFLVTQYGGGQLFTQLAWGEYMSWAASPQWKIFVDGRIEIYPDDVWDDYVRFMTTGDEEAIRKYGVDTLLLDSAKQATLCQRVEATGKWERVREDGNVVVYRSR